jgi:SAM-dependent methyltransferase
MTAVARIMRDAETDRAKPSRYVTGHVGFGDCIHQRAIVREMMKMHRVTLQTPYRAMYHDLEREGLYIDWRGNARVQERTERGRVARPPRRIDQRQACIGYNADTIHEHGSILAAQFASVGLSVPERPDFSLPVKEEWRRAARAFLAGRNPAGKPMMVYRPIVLNGFWCAPARAPDPVAYDALYRSIRDRFFVVSVCDLTKHDERIVGPAADVDLELHKGELNFEALAGMFAEAALVFGCPGFAPVLAQAVGTPVICTYGANESFRTTNAAGAHLVPTLAVEPIVPCEHHAKDCGCDKTIDVEGALQRVGKFVSEYVPAEPRVLIFATTYIDTLERLALTKQWVDLHKRLNPGCDFLIVDSRSPVDLSSLDCEVWSFPDNIGHLSRNGPNGPNSKGRDGWGRAFCEGLNRALAGGYDYAVHIEGDSLFRLKVMDIVREMKRDGVKVASVPVEGTKRKEVGWVETGLMFFDCGYLGETDFTVRYDWPNRTERPTPEKVIFSMLGRDLKMMSWRAERGDKSQITLGNITNLDWVTHCHDRPEIYDRFVEVALGEEPTFDNSTDLEAYLRGVVNSAVRLNFGCGLNRLPGWRNFDADIDITKRLPFGDASADFILAEHVIEHVEYKQALAFMRECRRVLKQGGVARFAVPSIEKVWKHADAEYFAFVKRWSKQEGLRPAIDALLNCHGHKAPWTESLLLVTAYQAGFDNVKAFDPGQSDLADLKGVEGHGKVIGDKFNWIETVVVEAS